MGQKADSAGSQGYIAGLHVTGDGFSRAPALRLGDDPMSGSPRTSADLDVRRRRILFRAWHRGIREMDLIMGRFADAELAALDEAEIAEFEQLIEVPDRELFDWLTDAVPVPNHYDTPIYRRLKGFHTHHRPLHI
jgi:antitoxin CptB